MAIFYLAARRHNDGFVVFLAKRVYNFVARAARVPETRVGNISIYLLGQLRFQGSLYCFESEPWERGCSGMSVADVIWCDVKVHFKVVKQHGFKCEWYVLFMKSRRLYSLSVKQRLLYIGESRPIFQATKREWQTQEGSIQQVAGNPGRGRFTIETPLQREWRLEIQCEKRRRRARTSIMLKPESE